MTLHHIDVYAGRAQVVSPREVRVTMNGAQETLTCRAMVVATGSVPARVPLPGADLPGVVTSDGLMDLDHLPRSVVVLGASAIGLEFACMFESLGCAVTVLGRRTFLHDAEEQLTRRFRTLLSRRGVTVAVGLEFQEIVAAGNGLQVRYQRRGKDEVAEGEIVLLATGRWPYAGDLGLEALGVQMNGRAIAVDENLETSVPGIYAIGDCIGGYMFAHVASHEGEVAAENILGPERRPMDYTVVPYCFFTNPEIASVGLTEAQAKAAGLAFQVSRFPYRASGRALSLGEEEGQVRLICATEAGGRGGRVLGVHIMGAQAGTLIAEAALAMRVGATAEQISTTIHTHPTLPEMVMEAAKGQLDGAIHYDQR
jgi:dihydrolipoamide dehydrogenase